MVVMVVVVLLLLLPFMVRVAGGIDLGLLPGWARIPKGVARSETFFCPFSSVAIGNASRIHILICGLAGNPIFLFPGNEVNDRTDDYRGFYGSRGFCARPGGPTDL